MKKKINVIEKNIIISGEALKNVLEIRDKTKRNISGSAIYLIQKGYEAFLKEELLLKNIIENQKV